MHTPVSPIAPLSPADHALLQALASFGQGHGIYGQLTALRDVRRAVEAGANPSMRLMAAGWPESAHEPVVFWLMRRLRCATSHQSSNAFLEAWQGLFEALCDRGADVHARVRGATLWQAWAECPWEGAGTRVPQMVQRLHAAGVSMDAADEEGNTALSEALFHQHWDQAEVLVAHSASLAPVMDEPHRVFRRLTQGAHNAEFNAPARVWAERYLDQPLAHLQRVDSDGMGVAEGAAGWDSTLLRRLVDIGVDFEVPMSTKHRTTRRYDSVQTGSEIAPAALPTARQYLLWWYRSRVNSYPAEVALLQALGERAHMAAAIASEGSDATAGRRMRL